MIFGGIQRTSTLDFPGVLACVVFTAGCDMDCFYCHNRALIAGTGQGISRQAVMDFLRRRQGQLDGLVVSGGEPTLHPDLADFLLEARGLGYKTKLDTNGGRPQGVEGLLARGLLSYVALDIKATAEGYASVCQCPGGLERAADTAALLAGCGVAYEVRTTLYPGLDLAGLAEILGSLPVQPRWRLNFFRMPEERREADLPRLAAPALTAGAIEAGGGALRAIQPNLMW